jgi:osmotically-inducible protein OsmY
MKTDEIKVDKAEMLDDDQLQQLISDRIDEDATFWTGGGRRRVVITVEVEDGHVTLNGVVRNRLDRRRADILARSLGAVGVDNRLRVLEAAETTDTTESKGSAQREGTKRQSRRSVA